MEGGFGIVDGPVGGVVEGVVGVVLGGVVGGITGVVFGGVVGWSDGVVGVVVCVDGAPLPAAS